MIETVKWSDDMERIAQEVISEHESDLGWIRDEYIRIAYLYSDRKKTQKKGWQNGAVLGECKKADPTLKELAKYDFVITFYGPNVEDFTEEQLHILMYHELLHITVEDGMASVRPHDYHVEDFQKVIDLYGEDWAKK